MSPWHRRRIRPQARWWSTPKTPSGGRSAAGTRGRRPSRSRRSRSRGGGVAVGFGEERPGDRGARAVEPAQRQRGRLADVVADAEGDRLDRLVPELVADAVDRQEELAHGAP